MTTECLPTNTTGHAVRGPNAVATGSDATLAAYIAGRSLVSIVASRQGPVDGGAGPAVLATISVHPFTVISVALHPSCPVVSIGTAEGGVVVCQALPTGSGWHHLPHPARSIAALIQGATDCGDDAVARRRSCRIAVPTADGHLCAGVILFSAADGPRPILSVAFAQAADRAILAAASEGAVTFWQLHAAASAAGAPICSFAGATVLHQDTASVARWGPPRQIVGTGGGGFAMCFAGHVLFYSVLSKAVESWGMSDLTADVLKGEGPNFVSVCVPTIAPSEDDEADPTATPSGDDTLVYALNANGLLVCFSATSGLATQWLDCKLLRDDRPAAVMLQCTGRLVFVIGQGVARAFTIRRWKIADSIRLDAIVGHGRTEGALRSGVIAGALLLPHAAYFFVRFETDAATCALLLTPNFEPGATGTSGKRVKLFQPSGCFRSTAGEAGTAMVRGGRRSAVLTALWSAAALREVDDALGDTYAYVPEPGARLLAVSALAALNSYLCVAATPTGGIEARVVAPGGGGVLKCAAACALGIDADIRCCDAAARRTDDATRFVVAAALISGSVALVFGEVDAESGVPRIVSRRAVTPPHPVHAEDVFRLLYVQGSLRLVLPGLLMHLGTDQPPTVFCQHHPEWRPSRHVAAVCSTEERLILATSNPCQLFTFDPGHQRLFGFSTLESIRPEHHRGAAYHSVAVDAKVSLMAVLVSDSDSSGTQWFIVVCGTSAMKEVARVLCARSPPGERLTIGDLFFSSDDQCILVQLSGRLLQFAVDDITKHGTCFSLTAAAKRVGVRTCSLLSLDAPWPPRAAAAVPPAAIPPLAFGDMGVRVANRTAETARSASTTRLTSATPPTRTGAKNPQTARSRTAERQPRGRETPPRSVRLAMSKDPTGRTNKQENDALMSKLEDLMRMASSVPARHRDPSDLVVVAPTSRVEPLSSLNIADLRSSQARSSESPTPERGFGGADPFAAAMTDLHPDSPPLIDTANAAANAASESPTKIHSGPASDHELSPEAVRRELLKQREDVTRYGDDNLSTASDDDVPNTDRSLSSADEEQPLQTPPPTPAPAQPSSPQPTPPAPAPAIAPRVETLAISDVPPRSASPTRAPPERKSHSPPGVDVKMKRLDILAARRSAAMQSVIAILKSIKRESTEYEQLKRETGRLSCGDPAPSPPGDENGDEDPDALRRSWDEIRDLLEEERRIESI